MHFKKHKPNPKHDDYQVRDTSYRAGRAAVMQKKKEPRIISAKEYEGVVDLPS